MAEINASLFCWKTGRHWSLGLRSTKYSVLKKPVVSVPSSGRPTWLTTCVTSGNEASRSEEHTSELQSLRHLVCRFLHDAAPTEIYTLSLHDALPILLKKPVVSVPSSGRPTWLTTCVTSGNEASTTRAVSMTRCPSLGPVDGASVARAQMAPSSRCGRNSEPMTPLKSR